MSLEALVSNIFPNFNYHSSSSSPSPSPPTTTINKNVSGDETTITTSNSLKSINSNAITREYGHGKTTTNTTPTSTHGHQGETNSLGANRGRKRGRRSSRTCKSKEKAETQRMTHIAIERNRRKQMNEYLAVLRSLMPDSYIQRGDQASIVGGAIEFVKELEQLLQSLEAQKRLILHHHHQQQQEEGGQNTSTADNNNNFSLRPFSQFFTSPQYSWCQLPGGSEFPSENQTTIAEIEVTLSESHASLRILSRRRPKQLFKLVSAFHSLHLTILHLNVTTLDPLVLYSFSAKVEEGCNLTSVDDIAGAVHNMLQVIEEEDTHSL
ncbi:hypothetical protein Sjap_004216 [Stephania japonica]|uniref:BHLH domain-containing protein n=1 Tax=Stephania japonica TaxID=461633 RepID=A0AAP0K1W0_9MAGN